MRDDWDARYKELVQEVLRGTGEVLVGLETATPTQRMDVVYRPDAAHRAERLQRGLLGRLTDGPSATSSRTATRRRWCACATTCGGCGATTTIDPSRAARRRRRR
jgi:hypothetical protein